MSKTFPDPILKLPLADIPMEGVSAYLAQVIDNHYLFRTAGQICKEVKNIKKIHITTVLH